MKTPEPKRPPKQRIRDLGRPYSKPDPLEPPLTLEEIRRELGFPMLPNNDDDRDAT